MKTRFPDSLYCKVTVDSVVWVVADLFVVIIKYRGGFPIVGLGELDPCHTPYPHKSP